MEIISQADKKQDYRQMVRKLGKKEFTLQKMHEYGFWPANLPTPYERQKNETASDYQKRKELLREYDRLADRIAGLYEDKNEISARLRGLMREFGETWDLDKVRKDVSKQIMQESIQRRAERKRQREEEKRRLSEAWLRHKADNIIFIGKGYSGALNDRGTDEAKLATQGLPVIRDDRELVAFLGIDYRELRFLTYHRDVVTVDHYHRYTVPKKKGGQRLIAAPKPLLKRAQRQILTGLLNKIEVSPRAHGFLRGKSVVTGAQAHKPAPQLLVNLDVADFFPSVTFTRVRGLFRSLGYSGYVASLLAMICTDCDRMPIEVKGGTRYVKTSERVLPQGSPASPMITNILCRHMDERIEELAAAHNFTYSRYADDISLSFAQTPEEHLVRKAVYMVMCAVENEGFLINPDKTRYLRPNARQVITGVVVNHPELGVPREWVRRLRASIHNASRLKERGELSPQLLGEISGRVAWLASVNAERYRKIIDSAKRLQD